MGAHMESNLKKYVDAKNVALLLQTLSNIKKLHETAFDSNRQRCFKHQILLESSKNCKILQNNHKKEYT